MNNCLKQLNQYIINHVQSESEEDRNHPFAQYVRKMRIEKRLTREELSIETGINLAKVVAIENGLLTRSQIELHTLNQLETSFGITYRYFMKRYGNDVLSTWIHSLDDSDLTEDDGKGLKGKMRAPP